jgi:hypothetical protein
VWRKQTGNVPILVAGRNRLEAHKRAGCETVLARAICGDTPEIARAVEAIEIEENLHRRELSPALRKTYTARLKALHEQDHPKSKGGRPSKTVPKAGKVSKPRCAQMSMLVCPLLLDIRWTPKQVIGLSY